MLLRQTILYLPAQVLSPIAQFISFILWTYFLTPEEMGVFALISAAQEFAYVGTLFWFTHFTMRYFDQNSEGATRTQFLNTESGVMICAGLAIACAVMSLPLFIEAHWNTALVTAALSYSVTRSIAAHLCDRVRTASDTISYSILQISWPVLGLLFGFVFIKMFGPTAASVLWGYAAAQIVGLLLAALRVEFGRNPTQVSRDMLKTGMRYGLPLVAGGLLVWVANNGIRFIIEGKEGAAAVGLVTVGWGLGLRVAGFCAMLVTAAAFPLAVTKAREHGMPAGQRQLVQSGVLLLAILAPATAGLWSIAAPLVERIIAEPFRETTAAVLPWAIVAGAARNLRIHFADQIFLLHERSMVPLGINLVDGILTLVGGALGLLYFGLHGSIEGAALSAVAGLLLSLALGFVMYRYAFPLGHLLRISAATSAMMVVVGLLPLAATGPSLFLAIVAGGAVYALVMMVLYPEMARRVSERARQLAGA
jgi:O-antigen/teichoic acid export membrane protein